MRQKNILKALILALIFSVGVLFLRSQVPGSKNSPGKESMEECTKNSNGESVELGFEGLPRQFFSSF